MKPRSIMLVALFLAVMSFGASVAHACPSCQAALAGDSSQGDLARGIYYSVLFMMSMPFAIVGTFGCVVYRAVQREKRRAAQAEQEKSRTSPSSEA